MGAAESKRDDDVESTTSEPPPHYYEDVSRRLTFSKTSDSGSVVSVGEEPTSLKDKALACLKSQWCLYVCIVALVVASINPDPVARFYSPISKAVIITLFALLGLTLDLAELRKGFFAWRIHLLCQSFSLLVIPCLYYALVYHWHLERSLGILDRNYAVGLMTALCMPTTTNTGPMLVREAKADVSLATANAALGNTIGAVWSPILAQVLIGGTHDSKSLVHSLASTLVSLSWEIFLPLFAGLVVQILEHQLAPGNLARLKPAFKALGHTILAAMFYVLFCKALAGSQDLLHGSAVALLVLWTMVVYVAFVALAWLVAIRLEPKQQVMFVIVAPFKTESTAVAIMSLIFGDSDALGQLCLPIVVYHAIQIIGCSLILPRLRRYATAHGTHSCSDDFLRGSSLDLDSGSASGEKGWSAPPTPTQAGTCGDDQTQEKTQRQPLLD